MSYPITDIIQWAKVAQPLARYGEAKKKSTIGASVDEDLDLKLYITRKDVESEYALDPSSSQLFPMGNYLLTLMGVYLFAAQQASGGGGSISPITPPAAVTPNPLDFIVSGGSLIATGASSIILDGAHGTDDFRGFDVNFNRGGQPQYTTNPMDGSTYYSWNKVTGLFSISVAAGAAEQFRIYV